MHGSLNHRSRLLMLAALSFMLALAVSPTPRQAFAEKNDIIGPSGSGEFGRAVAILPNGNIVVTDPSYDDGALQDVGAVYLYNGATRQLISRLTGTAASDWVGSGGITVLSNGNYVVQSPGWNAGRGAVTWGDGAHGIAGTVSAANSLVGGNPGDQVGAFSVTALPNGNYVVLSHNWNGGNGAATWGDGTRGISGTVSPANSLLNINGPIFDESLDSSRVVALKNGNYAVVSPTWNDRRGAVTWGDGARGISGTVSAANSLVGSAANDLVGYGPLTLLANGSYVVSSDVWNNYQGALTWGDGTRGITGTISAANSLVGISYSIGEGLGVTPLPSGNYVVSAADWVDGAGNNAGAVAWVDGTRGITGTLSAANSLINCSTSFNVHAVTVLANGNYVVDCGGAATWADGTRGITGTPSAANSLIGTGTITPLSDGNYVAVSPGWNAGRGALTWGDGTRGITGTVSPANSIVGTAPSYWLSDAWVAPLSNGSYVVSAPHWDNGGLADVGLVHWVAGGQPRSGTISAANSLIGAAANDRVGSGGVTALTNGNYVVGSPRWKNNGLLNSGASTWGDGTHGITGTVSAANSLVGSYDEYIGADPATALSNGNYVVGTPRWNQQRGAVTWADGTRGITGTVSLDNSLVGSAPYDRVGFGGAFPWVTALADDQYVVGAVGWNNGSLADAGAVVLANGQSGVRGPVQPTRSAVGALAYSGDTIHIAHHPAAGFIAVAFPDENRITLLSLKEPRIAVSGNGQPIVNGATAPVVADGSDFGGVALSQVITHTFAISNTGAAPLTLSGAISVSGAFAGDFAVTQAPSATIAPGGSASFALTFVPGALGTRAAIVTIASSDIDTPLFSFAVGGAGVIPAAFSSAPPPAGRYGSAYSHEVRATGQPAPSISLIGTLPPGLSWDAASSIISGTPSQAGTYPGYRLLATSGSLTATQPFTLTIDKAPLLVTADDQAMAAGAALPDLTVSYAGFVNGDTAATLDSAPTVQVIGNPNQAGQYLLRPGSAADGDYALTYGDGVLKVIRSLFVPLLSR